MDMSMQGFIVAQPVCHVQAQAKVAAIAKVGVGEKVTITDDDHALFGRIPSSSPLATVRVSTRR